MKLFDRESLVDHQPCVGAVRVNLPFTKRTTNGVWFDVRKTNRGVYPLYLCMQPLFPKSLFVRAIVDATIIEVNKPGEFDVVFDGAEKSHSSYSVGDRCSIHHDFELVKAIEQTGATPNNGNSFDTFIDFSWWQIGFEESEFVLNRSYSQLNDLWDHSSSTKTPDELDQLKWCAQSVYTAIDNIEIINRAKSKWSRNNEMTEIWKANTAWISGVEFSILE